MKKFIPKLILFFLFASVFYICLIFAWGRFMHPILKPNINFKIGSNGSMFTRIKELKNVKNKELDILFLGSSHVYRSFDPRILNGSNYKTFILGSSAQTPVETKLLLKRYLDKLNPKLIIYDVSPGTLESDGIESSLDIIANDKNDFQSYQLAWKLNHIKTYNTLLYATWRDFFNMNDSYIEPIKKGRDTYIPGGFVEKEMIHFTPEKFDERTIDFKPMQFEAVQDILLDITNKNIDLVLVTVPISPALFSSYLNYDYYDSLMGSYGEYYNFNRILSLDDSLHFFDRSHLNQSGVEILNKKLIKILSRRGNKNADIDSSL